MRSISAKILLWSLGTFALALVAFGAISWRMEHRNGGPGAFFAATITMIQDDTCLAYERGGPAGLDAQLRRLDAYLEGEHILTDRSGRDLVNGANRSDLLRLGQSPPEPPRLVDGKFILIGIPRDSRYRFVTIVRPVFDRHNILPYYAAILLVIAVLGSILAIHLARPLRHLRQVVDRFGHGDLDARVHSTRKDEIGDLSRAFDQMAGRIATLLAAERRLLQDVSHELRSPLARLGFAVELARTSADRGAAMDRIKKDVDRLTVLVDELLQLTSAEGDASARRLEDVPLDHLLQSVVEDCAVEAEAKGSPLLFRVGPGPLRVVGDGELLRRAVENVLRNAIRYTPPGAAVDVDLRADPSLIVLNIRDYGVGVPDSVLGSIFDPFFRVEGDRSRSSGGVGLGLAIAARAIDLHHGKITAHNAHPGLSVSIALPPATTS